jgi:stress-induced morphogen
MTIKLRAKRPDQVLRQIRDALEKYDEAHPQAEIEAYRQNSVSVRIRILNPEFAGKSRAQREEEVWAVLNELPEEAVAEISLLLLLTPEEAARSFANSEFDDPIPSKL